MTPEQFVTKWKAADLKERAAAQSHFNDLCELLDEPKPTDADPKGEWYCFERGATKTTGGEGWADVWKRGCFGWEYKSRGRNLDEAVDQLKRYALALENPPLLIACNLDRFRIVTNWTNAVSARHEFDLDGLREPVNRDKLKWAFAEPERLRPGLTRRHVTEIAAEKFAELATGLRAKGHAPQTVAHFVNRLVFCMFAEDIGLLPNAMFTRMLKEARAAPAEFEPLCRSLFGAMQTGGRLGFERVDWFNGGLFDDDTALPLSRPEIERALDAADMDWSQIDPSIMGTLFERGLDPDKRSQLGAHYTDAEKIMKIIDPVIQRPLEAEWAETKAKIEEQLARAQASRSSSARTRAHNEASSSLSRLSRSAPRVPRARPGLRLRQLPLPRLADAEGLGASRQHRGRSAGSAARVPAGRPGATARDRDQPLRRGARRVSVWIGEIQWMQRNGFGIARNPILRPLDTIECGDAILSADGTEPEWPPADVDHRQSAISRRQAHDRQAWRGLHVYTLFGGYRRQGAGGGGSRLLLVRQGPGTARDCATVDESGLVATRLDSRRCQPTRARSHSRARASIFEAWDDEPWMVEARRSACRSSASLPVAKLSS